jgi:hypothetical protein
VEQRTLRNSNKAFRGQLCEGKQNKNCKEKHLKEWAGNTKGGSITVPLTSCLTGLE